MKIWAILRGDASIGFCPVIETARVYQSEAEEYVTAQEVAARRNNDDESYWTPVEIDLVLNPTPPVTLREEVATNG